jgi:hypothetical protein
MSDKFLSDANLQKIIDFYRHHYALKKPLNFLDYLCLPANKIISHLMSDGLITHENDVITLRENENLLNSLNSLYREPPKKKVIPFWDHGLCEYDSVFTVGDMIEEVSKFKIFAIGTGISLIIGDIGPSTYIFPDNFTIDYNLILNEKCAIFSILTTGFGCIHTPSSRIYVRQNPLIFLKAIGLLKKLVKAKDLKELEKGIIASIIAHEFCEIQNVRDGKAYKNRFRCKKNSKKPWF